MHRSLEHVGGQMRPPDHLRDNPDTFVQVSEGAPGDEGAPTVLKRHMSFVVTQLDIT